MTDGKTIAFFPEQAYGPALNSVGIAQECADLGHEPVFITDPSMEGLFEDYGFEEHYIDMSDPDMSAEEKARYWDEFINKHIPNFNKDAYDQIDNYIEECWEAIVETAEWSQQGLPDALEEIDPDLIAVDNVVMFPAVKNYDAPWVRITSCTENEIPDPGIPPYLSGAREDDYKAHERFRERYKEVLEPIHDDFNDFLAEHGIDPYPVGEFMEPSPYLNLMLYPEPLQWDRWIPLDPDRFQYLEGCVRQEEDYEVPDFGEEHNDAPLLYLSFGSLGAGDTELLKRLIDFLGGRDYRCLVNIGEYGDVYDDVEIPDNVVISDWFPQPSVIDQCDVVVHHGGNNTTNECLYYGVPAVVMPYAWDGFDNATRVDETGHGFRVHRTDWEADELAEKIDACVTDDEMQARLDEASDRMQSENGSRKAAELLDDLLEQHA